MSLNFLEFEKPIAELEAKIEALRDVSRHGGEEGVDLDKEIASLEKKSLELKEENLWRPRCMAGSSASSPPTAPIHLRLHRARIL